MDNEWQESFFGCLSNVPVCFVIFCLPGGICAVSSTAVEKATGKGKIIPYLLIWSLGCIGGAINRESIKKNFKVNENG